MVELAGLSRHVRLARQGSIRVLEEWLDVTDGEQRVTFNKHTHTIHHIGAEIAGYNTKWVLLDHTTNVAKLLAANRVRLPVHKAETLADRKIGPVRTILVRVWWEQNVVESRLSLR